MFTIDPINPADDQAIARIIREVGAEFGAVGEGFGPSDPEVANMSANYRDEDASSYWVGRVKGVIAGGGGIAPFNNSTTTCELKKLFLLPEYRGLGLGLALTQRCLNDAKARGYTHCYLDTLANMTKAVGLYESLGFERLKEPLAGTPHHGCDIWMLKAL